MTPAQQNDTRWFQQHPDRAYRLRRAIADEVKDGPSRAVRFSANSITSKPVHRPVFFDTEENAREAFHG